jgi:hypothetical protein
MPREDAPITATVFGSNSGLKRSRMSWLMLTAKRGDEVRVTR